MTKLSLAQYQSQFCEHLLSAELGPQSDAFLALLEPQFGQQTATQECEFRFGIYRNNVMHSLRSALGELYPVVKRLIGDDCFNLIAVEFIRQQPPKNPTLLFYGDEFIRFIAQHRAVADLGYLVDVAKLEYAHHLAFHSKDKDALDVNKLATIAPDKLGDVVFDMHPSATLIHSPWAVDGIWHENIKAQPGSLDIDALGQATVLVYRAGLDIQIVSLEVGCYTLLTQLNDGHSINQAWLNTQQLTLEGGATLDSDELSPMLGYLLGLGVFVDYKICSKDTL